MPFRLEVLFAAVLLIPALVQAIAQEPVISPSANYNANLSSVQVADLNSDNAPEIIGLAGASNAIVVLKNLGNGKYSAPTYYSVSGVPNGLAVGDLNGDGKLDIAVAMGDYNAAQGKVAVFRGVGNATLEAPQYYTVAIPANSIAVADFNNDNRPDIAVIGNSNDNGTNTVAILTNTGSSFTQKSFAATAYFTAQGVGPDSDYVNNILAGDFNGDGRIDIAYRDSCAQCFVPEEVLFVLANTTSGWQAKMPAGGSGSTNILAADIDGDGLTDFVIPYAGCHTPCIGVEVDYMKKDFTVANSQALDVLNEEDGPFPYQVVVGDFNNDGIADIAGYSAGGEDQNYNQLPYGLMMWTGVGNRTFNKLKYYDQPNPPAYTSIFTAAGFVDKNGARDLVLPAGTETQVWLNSTSTASDPCPYPTTGGVHVCAPKANVASGTVHFLASARTNTQPLNRIELWIDGKKKIQVFNDRLKIDLAVANGTHTADFYEVGASGLNIKQSVNFKVGP
jgi:hypothetical protein